MTSTKCPTAYVITANDSIEAVCLGTEAEAEALRGPAPYHALTLCFRSTLNANRW